MKKSKRFSLFGITDDGFDLSVVPLGGEPCGVNGFLARNIVITDKDAATTGIEDVPVRTISADALIRDIRTIRAIVREHKEATGRRIALIEGLLDRLGYKVAPEE